MMITSTLFKIIFVAAINKLIGAGELIIVI